MTAFIGTFLIYFIVYFLYTYFRDRLSYPRMVLSFVSSILAGIIVIAIFKTFSLTIFFISILGMTLGLLVGDRVFKKPST